MPAVLAVSSYPYRTSPVLRGAWILESILGTPPPPPPAGVPALEKQASAEVPKTVREMLTQHRADPACASCHSRIDPLGFALENYDAIGAWRDRQNGERFKNDKTAPPLDVSGVLPGGREFTTLRDFKRALLAEKDHFVRGFVEKVLSYALGRPVGATDRGTIDEIIKSLEPADRGDQERYRMQSLIQAVVATSAFQTK
jgi:hypothetical protein